MSGTFNVTLPSGATWTPTFVQSIDEAKCIGCGRCFRVCPRGVLELVGLDDEGARIAVDPDGDDEEEYEKKVMTIAHQRVVHRLHRLLEDLPEEVLHARGGAGLNGPRQESMR